MGLERMRWAWVSILGEMMREVTGFMDEIPSERSATVYKEETRIFDLEEARKFFRSKKHCRKTMFPGAFTVKNEI